MQPIEIPDPCLLLIAGPSGAGKSTFARKHFLATEVLSSDNFRALVCDDESNQAATADAFDCLYFVANRRLQNGRLTVIDATNVKPQDRKGFVELAARFNVPALAIVLNVPANVCHDRNRVRQGRGFGPEIVETQISNLKNDLCGLECEGFRPVYILNSPQEVDAVTIRRTASAAPLCPS